jgi:predicted GNAT family acetyltransferase
MSTAESILVRHNVPEHRFEVEFAGDLAVAEYELPEGRMVFTHTFVPPELRGRGIAEKLVRAGLEYARAEKRTVVPLCSYVALFIKRNPEFSARVE